MNTVAEVIYGGKSHHQLVVRFTTYPEPIPGATRCIGRVAAMASILVI